MDVWLHAIKQKIPEAKQVAAITIGAKYDLGSEIRGSPKHRRYDLIAKKICGVIIYTIPLWC
jgi:hypothetical protein